MVDARQELSLRSRAIASGELPLPERREGETDGDWLNRIAAGRGLPAIGSRFIAVKEFLATNAQPVDRDGYRIKVLEGDVLEVVGADVIQGEQVVFAEIDAYVVIIEPGRLARCAKPCRGPLPTGHSQPSQQSDSAGDSFEPSSTKSHVRLSCLPRRRGG